MYYQFLPVLLANCLLSAHLRAQSYFYNNKYYDNPLHWETGISAGGMNCLTDLGGNSGPGKRFIKDINLQNTRPCAGLYGSLLYEYTIGVRLEAAFGQVTAYDSILRNDNSEARHRYQRNLHFRSGIKELLLTGEFHPLSFLALRSNRPLPLFSPYLLAGIGIFSFKPQAEWNGRWISLPSLHTEVQGFREYADRPPYRLLQIHFPAGIGLKYELSALLNTRLELVYRFLQTDYLDDVSTRYIDPALFYKYLPAAEALLAEQLADRRRVRFNDDANAAGRQRGNSSDRDAFFSISLKLGLIINRRKR